MQGFQITSEELHRVFALHPGGGFLDIILNVLRKVEIDARKAGGQVIIENLGELGLIHPRRPGVEGLEGHEELGVEEARRVGPVIGAPVLGDHGLYLGIALHLAAHVVDEAVARLKRDCGWHFRAYPEIALFKVGEKLETKRTRRQNGQGQEQPRTP